MGLLLTLRPNCKALLLRDGGRCPAFQCLEVGEVEAHEEVETLIACGEPEGAVLRIVG